MPLDPERLATKDDLALLNGNLRSEMDEPRLSIRNEVRRAFRAQIRIVVPVLVASVCLIALINVLTVLAD